MLSPLPLLLSLCVLKVFGVATDVCKDMNTLLPDLVVSPPTEAYDTSRTAYFDLSCRLHPACIVKPTSAEDVSVIVKHLTRNGKTAFAIKGGGHNPISGWANIDEPGITIDLRNLNSITLSDDRGVVSVGGGAVWVDVYKFLEQYRLTAVGARVADIGVGGFLTGGGSSVFSRTEGWGADNVVNFQVVLANGEIVNANAACNEDLYQALKGGGNNFGIVTRFDLRTLERGPLRAAVNAWNEAAYESITEEWTRFMVADRTTFDPYEDIQVSFLYNSTADSYSATSFQWYTSPEGNKTGDEFFERWAAIPDRVSTMEMQQPMSQWAELIQSFNPTDARTAFLTTSLVMTPTIMSKVVKPWRDAAADTYRDLRDVTFVLNWSPMPLSPEGASNSLGLGEAERDLCIVLISINWLDGADSNLIRDRGLLLIRQIEAVSKEEGAYRPFKYANYAAREQDVLAGYGAASLARLREVAHRYDAEGVFQRQVPGGYKLWNEQSQDLY